MPTDAEITFADHMGRFYARRYAFPPMVGRLIGYLAVCDPPEQTIGELAEALLASRSAITGAVKGLETMHSSAGRALPASGWTGCGIDMSSPQAHGDGHLRVRGAAASWPAKGWRCCAMLPPERRAVLLEMAAFADFLVEQMPQMREEWTARRAELVASGDAARPRPPREGRDERATARAAITATGRAQVLRQTRWCSTVST